MTARLRVFAGPNGSGKSTLAEWLSQNYSVNLYRYINADVMFAEIGRTLKTACPLPMDNSSLLSYTSKSTYPEAQKAFFATGKIRIKDDFVLFAPEAVNSYTVAMVADFFRSEYLAAGISFSCETVFSHLSKLDLLRQAQARGFRTYLYFVSTEYPEINVSRVATRVQGGGHDVPFDKVITRFQRCLDNVAQSLPFLNRAFFFDNTGIEIRFIAEATEGQWTFFNHELPQWFIQSVYKKSP